MTLDPKVIADRVTHNLQATSGNKYRVFTIGRLTIRWRKR